MIHPHREWGCAAPGKHILTGNGDVTHQECSSSQGIGMCFTGNAHSFYKVAKEVFPTSTELLVSKSILLLLDFSDIIKS